MKFTSKISKKTLIDTESFKISLKKRSLQADFFIRNYCEIADVIVNNPLSDY